MAIDENTPKSPEEFTDLPASSLTLRDHFAAVALQGWLARFGPGVRHPAAWEIEYGDPVEQSQNARERCEELAGLAYDLADAMLAVRDEER